MRITFMCMAMLLAAQSALADVYYIRTNGNDSNDGRSAARAFASVSHFASIAGAGDVGYVGAGEYSGTVKPENSGTASEPIRFVADRNGSMTGDAGEVKLVAGHKDHAIEIDGVSNIRFEGFIIEGGEGTVDVTGSENLVIERCAIVDSGKHGVRIRESISASISSTTFARCEDGGIDIEDGGDVEIVDCTISSSGKEGIKVKGASRERGEKKGREDKDDDRGGRGNDGKRGDRDDRDKKGDNGKHGKDGEHGGFDDRDDEHDKGRDDDDKKGKKNKKDDRKRNDDNKGRRGDSRDQSSDRGEDERTPTVYIGFCSIDESGDHGISVESGARVGIVNTLVTNSRKDGIHAHKDSTLWVWNSTMADNNDSGLYIHDGGTVEVVNSIAYRNDVDGFSMDHSKGRIEITHHHNLSFGNGFSNFEGFTPGETELERDPRFTSAASYKPGNGSPAIDAGFDASSMLSLDLDGISRPAGGGWDIGCYESSSEAVQQQVRVVRWREVGGDDNR